MAATGVNGAAGTATEAVADAPGPSAPVAPDGALMASSVKHLARGGSLNLVGAVSNGVLSFALVVVLTRTLGPAGAGAFFGATSLFMLATNAVELGADTGLVRFIARYRALGRLGDIRRAMTVSFVPVLAISTVAAVAMAVFAPQLAHAFTSAADAARFATYVRWMAPFLPLSVAVTLYMAACRGFGAMAPTVLVSQVGRPALQPVLILLAHLAGVTGAAFALAWVGPIGIGVVPAAWWYARLLRRTRAGATSPQKEPRPTEVVAKEFWRFTAPRGLAGVLEAGLSNIGVLLIGGLSSAAAAGTFAAATRYMVAGRMFTSAVTQAMSPTISGLFARRESLRARSLYQLTTAWSVTLVWPIFLTVAVFAPLFLRAFGSGFGAGASVLVILAGSEMFSGACGPVNVVLLMGGRSSWSLFNTCCALAVNVGVTYLLVPRYGINGAAIAWAASVVAANALPLFQVWWSMAMHPFGPGVRQAAVASLLCFGAGGLAVRFLLGTGPVAFAVFAVLSVGAYAAFLRRSAAHLELPLLWGTLSQRFRSRSAASRSSSS